MTRYYSTNTQWHILRSRLTSFNHYYLHYGAMVKMFEHIDETERLIKESDLGYLYAKVDKYYDSSIAAKIRTSMESTEAVLEKNIHKNTLASIDSKGCDLATKAISLLNQVNSGKNVYESQHITVQETKSGTRGMNDYGVTKSVTRPMTADELMRLDYAPLNNVRDDFKARLEQLQNDPSLLGEELSVEQLQALQNMTIQDMMGYTGDLGEYIMVLSDRVQRWSFWEPIIDVTISIMSLALAVPTGGLSLGVAAAYFTAKAAWYISNDTNMLTGLPLTNNDKGWLVFDAVTSIFAAGAGLKLLQTGSKVPGTVMKAITATDKALNVLELSIAAGTGLYALQNQQYGTSIVMLGLVAFGAKGLKGSSDFDLGRASKGASGANLKNLDDFARGTKSFDDVVNDFSKVYSDKVNSNKTWSWDQIPGSESLTAKQRKDIKAKAVELNQIPDIPNKQGTKAPDFGKADVIYKIDEKQVVLDLPEDLWKMSDKKQFDWLDSQLPGGERPSGYTWHHSEVPGTMELVPYGIHNSTYHTGGRAAGGWATGKR